MMRRRIPCAVAMLAAGILGAGCGGSSYSSDDGKLVPVSGVTLTKTSTYLLLGNEEQLVENVLPANATEKRVLWESSNDQIVSVAAAGRIKGIAVGTARITVRTADGGKVAHCEVTVSRNQIPVTGITLDVTKIDVTAGTARTLKATLTPANANNTGLTWDVQPSGIAKIEVAADGYSATITGIKEGVATVTVTSQDNSQAMASATVNVTPVAVTGVALSQPELTLQAPKAGALNGDSVPLTATVAPTNASNREVTWTTSDAAVAMLTSTVGSTVTVIARKEGTATITVKTVESGFTQSCNVTVVAAPVGNVAVTGVNLNPTVVSLEATPATTTIVYAIIEPADATKKGVYWTTSDKTVAAISPVSGGSATADSVSGSAVIVTAAGLGAAKLTATTEDGGHQAMADVGVYMVDAVISGTLATTFNKTQAGGSYDTKLGGAGAYQHVPVGKLVFYSDANGFQPQPGGTGINLNFYAAGATPAQIGGTIPVVKAYVGVNKDYTVPPAGFGSLRISVTAAATGGAPTLALLEHATGKVIDLKSLSGAPPYVFDGVPPGIQVDLVDGAADGPVLNISRVRVEPSTTAAKDITPPADVTSASATVASGTSLTVSWANPANVDFDHVEISCPSTPSVTVPKTGTSYTFTGLTTGTSYTFTIKAVDGTGNKSAGVSVGATPTAVAALLDVTIPSTVFASFVKTTDASGVNYYNTKSSTTGQWAEVAVSPLVYFADNNGFKDGDADGGIMFNHYASGTTTPVTVNTTGQRMQSYIGIPAASITTTKTTVKVTVTAKAYVNAGTPSAAKIALAQHTSVVNGVATGTVLGVKDLTGTKATYVFDPVPANVQLDLFNGGANGTYMYVEAVRVE